LQDYEKMRTENERMKSQISEDERTMEEMAFKLSQAKLEVDSLREESSTGGTASGGASTWMDDAYVNECPVCNKEFSISRRKVISTFRAGATAHKGRRVD
jgi:predicted  nucleic acid-binding Zn-ribbon protein